MALPPILSNLPIIKLFKSDNTQSAKAESSEAKGGANPKDVVEISDAALKKLAETGKPSPASLDDVRGAAIEARNQISESQVSLGLDPDFA